MNTKLSELAKRIKLGARSNAAWKTFKNFQKPFGIVFKEDVFLASMKKTLIQYFGGGIFANQLILHDVSEALVKEQLNISRSTSLETAKNSGDEIIQIIIQKYCLVAGVAAAWELELKFLAAKLDVDVFVEKNEGEHIETRPSGRIVKGILTKYPRLNIDLENCLEIRNGLIHGNLQQLKVLMEGLLSKEELKEMNPRMAILNLQSNDIRMANDKFTKAEAKALGPFMWFISGGNTRLLDFANARLEEGLKKIRAITLLAGLSFDETVGYFDQLAKEGTAWTSDQRSIFTVARRSFIGVPESEIAKELDKLHLLFELKS
jgi:hypothetical protein